MQLCVIIIHEIKKRKCPSIINKINLDEYNNKLSDNNKT